MRALLVLWVLACLPASAFSAERFVVIVSGASGGEKYAVLQQTWSEELVATFTSRYGIPAKNLIVLTEEAEDVARATGDNVRQLFARIEQRLTAEDTLILILLGHGTIDGPDAKFNLVGPDLTASEWKALLDPLPGRVAVVNTTESSFPFLEELSLEGRVVITATDSVAQRFATVFPEYFVQALKKPASDIDKDGRLSLYEAFDAASAAVRVHYEQRGQLSTERPLIDDNGDRVGRESQAPGLDGAIARTIYFDPDRVFTAADIAMANLERERERLRRDVEELKARKPLLADEVYLGELEKLLIELARVASKIREAP